MNSRPPLKGESAIPAPRNSSAAHAIEYSKTAALLRRRALQPQRTDDERVELRRRAEWYERRAVVKREGGIMPPELRTPLESLELVNELRQRLAEVYDLAEQLSFEEMEAFAFSLPADRSDQWRTFSGESTKVALKHWFDLTGGLLGFLGVRESAASGELVFLPFFLRTVETP